MKDDELQTSVDEERNEPAIFRDLFGAACLADVERLHGDLVSSMREVDYEGATEALDGFVFLHEVVATALWKYQCSVGDTLQAFARSYDRLDLPEEMYRLYREAQGS